MLTPPPSPPRPGRARTHAPSARLGKGFLCSRGIRARGGGHPSGDGIDRTRPAPWAAVAIEGVDTENKEAVPVPEGWGEQTPEDDISYARMLRFILPTLGIWLASPIMSLVDAGVVGESSRGRRAARKCTGTKSGCICRSRVLYSKSVKQYWSIYVNTLGYPGPKPCATRKNGRFPLDDLDHSGLIDR